MKKIKELNTNPQGDHPPDFSTEGGGGQATLGGKTGAFYDSYSQ